MYVLPAAGYHGADLAQITALVLVIRARQATSDAAEVDIR